MRIARLTVRLEDVRCGPQDPQSADTKIPNLTNVEVSVTPAVFSVCCDRMPRETRVTFTDFSLTPSWPRRSDGRPKHVFYSSTAYIVHSPV